MQGRINLRVKKILLILCQEPNYISIAAIAREIGVSAKTILRELADGEAWLFAKGCSLSKKPGVGIKIDASQERRNILAEILQSVEEESLYSPQERQIVIISELLQNQEPVKLYNFTKILKVTESTISNDLDKVAEWFFKQNIRLIRKPGLGIYIEGPEKDIRRAMIHFIYENTDENKLLSMIRSSLVKAAEDTTGIGIETRRRLLNLVDEEIIKNLQMAINEAEKQIGYKLADSAYAGLIVHLALAIQRIRKGDKIAMPEDFLAELKKYSEYEIAESMAQSIALNFAIEVPESEIGYITMHLRGSKNFSASLHTKEQMRAVGNFELVTLAKEIIRIAEVETGHMLKDNEKLLIDLVNHLGPAISRLKMNMDIRNPLLEEIKESYADLLQVSKKCIRAVEKRLKVIMPESEIAYIAMHLGAAIEEQDNLPQIRSRCVIACATGMGTARLMAAKLEKDFPDIEIVDIVSALYLEDSNLVEKGIDFIISTIKIEEAPIPVVTVNPLLFAEDKEKISAELKKLGQRSVRTSCVKAPRLKLKDRLAALGAYNQAALQILEHFFLEVDQDSQSVAEIITRTLSGLSLSDRFGVEKALMMREEQGGTFISGHHFILLHAKTAAVDKLYFGIVRPESALFAENSLGELEKVKLGVIMLAPEGATEQALETMGYLSRCLVERKIFLEVLQNGGFAEAFEELAQILWVFYKAKNNEIMEG